MGNETKIGIFVLVGVVLFGTAIFLLGDYSFKNFYQVDIEFNDIAGLPDKSMVKLSGVEVGKVKKIYMEDGGVIVQVNIFEGIKIYRDARFFIGSTSIIGSKYLQIDQGTRFSGLIKKGDRVKGENNLSLDRALTAAIADVRKIMSGFDGKRMGSNLNSSLANLREITANINQLVATSKPHAENIMVRLDSLTARLDDVMEKTNRIMAKVDSGGGTIGALMSDKTMKDDVADALSNLKDASASAKDALGKIKGFRTYFEFGAKYEP
ncbi:MAG: MlaD family protein, partial [Elusimicrobiota bacterium]|nr:MlaD family protein [Elusimicrobiota bacterium]